MGTIAFGVVWVFIGIFWLRRASVAEKADTLMTLNPSADNQQGSRERHINKWLGIGSLVLGVVTILAGLFHLVVAG